MVGPWQLQEEGVIDQDTRDVLKADDLLNRVYADPSSNQAANLFIAAFRSQRNGKAPHSPKNCLPGNGWTPLNEREIRIDVGAAAPIPVNEYVVQHGEARSVVLYWYQSRDRAVANEYKAKFWVIADAIRYNRTDTALIRVDRSDRQSRYECSRAHRHRFRQDVLSSHPPVPSRIDLR